LYAIKARVISSFIVGGVLPRFHGQLS
jgi:hypothetical protein